MNELNPIESQQEYRYPIVKQSRTSSSKKPTLHERSISKDTTGDISSYSPSAAKRAAGNEPCLENSVSSLVRTVAWYRKEIASRQYIWDPSWSWNVSSVLCISLEGAPL